MINNSRALLFFDLPGCWLEKPLGSSKNTTLLRSSKQLHPMENPLLSMVYWYQHLQSIFKHLGGGFKYFLFSPLLGEMIQSDNCFSKGLKPTTSLNIRWIFQANLCLFPWLLVKISTFIYAEQRELFSIQNANGADKFRHGFIHPYSRLWKFSTWLFHHGCLIRILITVYYNHFITGYTPAIWHSNGKWTRILMKMYFLLNMVIFQQSRFV